MSKTLSKLKQNYLTATQLALAQLQPSEQTPSVDAEFEKKYELIMSTKNSNLKMLTLAQKLSNQMTECVDAERDLDQFLSRKGHRPSLQKTLDVVGRVLALEAADRADQLTCLSCLREDCEELAEGGVADYVQDAEEAEAARVAYAESLVYMRKMTENLNPEQYSQMNNFRQIQSMVREQKQNFDELQQRLENLNILTDLREKVLGGFIEAYLSAQVAFYERQYILSGSVHNALLAHERVAANDENPVIASLSNVASSSAARKSIDEPGPSSSSSS